MSVFVDSSALVKRYADEDGAELVSNLDDVVVSGIARAEVPAAIWRKHRTEALSQEDAAILVRAFEWDWLSDAFAIMMLHDAVLSHAGRLCAMHPLRAYAAVQLASGLALRAVDPALSAFVCFDDSLRAAAQAEGLATVP